MRTIDNIVLGALVGSFLLVILPNWWLDYGDWLVKPGDISLVCLGYCAARFLTAEKEN